MPRKRKKKSEKRIPLSITVSPELFEYIQQEARRTGLTKSGLIAVALDHYRMSRRILDRVDTLEEFLKLVKEGEKQRDESK